MKYIYSNLKEGKKKYGKTSEVFRYRGYELGIWFDDPGQCLFTIWHGEEVSFGTYNTEYEGDCKYLVDKELDEIYCDHHGMVIKWRDNAWGNYRDIICEFRSRLVKVYLVDQENPEATDFEAIKKDASELCAMLEEERLKSKK